MFTVFLCYNYDCLKNYIMLYLTRMQVAFCLVLLGPLGRRACSWLSCSSRALQHKSRQKDERGCAKVSHKGSHHFQHLWSLSQKKEREREREGQIEGRVCVWSLHTFCFYKQQSASVRKKRIKKSGQWNCRVKRKVGKAVWRFGMVCTLYSGNFTLRLFSPESLTGRTVWPFSAVTRFHESGVTKDVVEIYFVQLALYKPRVQVWLILLPYLFNR